METRAIITKNEKEFIATHWDGYPASLGKDLIGKKTDEEIIEVAKEHIIDFAHKSLLSILNKDKYKEIAKKTKGIYSKEDIAKLHKEGKQSSFNIMGAEDYPINSIEGYDDFANYQYDFTNGKWRFKELSGFWNGKGLRKFKPLTKEAVKRGGE